MHPLDSLSILQSLLLTMKLSILATLFGTAAAFAPASQGGK